MELNWDDFHQLLDLQTDAIVATTHERSSLCIPLRRRKAGIEVNSELTSFLDMVLLSFLICQKDRRRLEPGGEIVGAAGEIAGGVAGA